MVDLMWMPFVKGFEIGGWCRGCTHAARRLTRFSGPGHYCSANHPKWSRLRDSNWVDVRDPLLVRTKPSAATLHPNKSLIFFFSGWNYLHRLAFHLLNI